MLGILTKIMVVDDETVQRNGLQSMLQKMLSNADVVACANGKIALENMQEDPPQLLITDIRMPIMDGMTLIQMVAKIYPQTKIVLISAYQEFSYAQKAIQCQVLDYLIKPYRKETVQQVLERVEKQMLDENETEKQLADFRQYHSQHEQQQQQQRLIQLLAGNPSSELTASDLNYRAIVALRFRSRQLAKPHRFVELSKRQKNLVLSQMMELFPNSQVISFHVSMKQESEKEVLFCCVQDTKYFKNIMLRWASQLYEENILMWAGASEISADMMQQAKLAYQQAEEMLTFGFYHEEGSVYCYEETKQLLQTPVFSTTAIEKEISLAWRNLENKKMALLLQQLKAQFQQDPKIYPRRVRHRLSSFVVHLMKEIYGLVSQEEYDELLNDAYMKYGACESLEELFIITEQILGNTNGFFQFHQDKYDAVEASIQYIKSHLEEDLSLQTVAKRMHFHPNYLSGLMKQKLGMSYTNFVVQKRMELAAQLLQETDLKILEIAGRCGFQDNSYFNRVFRKEKGCSPEQFRKVSGKW